MREIILIFIIFCTTTNICFSQQQIDDPIINAIKEETERACSNLKEKGHPSINFLCTNIIENISETYHASKGKQIEYLSDPRNARINTTTMMSVGDSTNSSPIELSYRIINREKNATAIKIDLWHTYDQLYKAALAKYIKKRNLPKSYIEGLSPEQRKLKDFSYADTVIHIEPLYDAKTDKKRISDYITEYSKVFVENDSLLSSGVTLTRNIINRWMYNSEGSMVRTSRDFYVLNAVMSMFSSSDLPISRSHSISISSLDELPAVEDLKNRCREIMAEMSVMSSVKKLDRIEFATILIDDNDVIQSLNNGVIVGNVKINSSLNISLKTNEYSQGKKLQPYLNNLKNRRIMTEDISIKSLNIPSYNGVCFLSYNPVDAIGTRSCDSMTMVENGFLRNLANTRVPTVDFPTSNGHYALAYPFYSGSVRPSVVKIEINKDKLYSSRQELYNSAIRQIKERGEQYIYILSKGVFKRVDINTGEEFEISSYKTNANFRHNSSIFGATSDIYVSPSGSITPKSIVLNDVEISPKENRVSWQKSYNTVRRPIVERPKK